MGQVQGEMPEHRSQSPKGGPDQGENLQTPGSLAEQVGWKCAMMSGGAFEPVWSISGREADQFGVRHRRNSLLGYRESYSGKILLVV